MEAEKVVIKVGIADMNVVKTPHAIRTTGLGSCVGLILYDEYKKQRDFCMSFCQILIWVNRVHLM